LFDQKPRLQYINFSMKSVVIPQTLIVGAIAFTLVACNAPIVVTSPTETSVTAATPKPAQLTSQPETINSESLTETDLAITLKQLVRDAYKRQFSDSKVVLRLVDAVAIADDYAIVDGSGGDAVIQALLQRQQGVWRVVALELGEPFSEPGGLLAQKVSPKTVQRLINQQNAIQLQLLVKREKACVTVSDDPNPPTNVRSTPAIQANRVGTLQNGQLLEVVNYREGWLELSRPVKGWVALNLTKVGCGDEVQATRNYIEAVYRRGLQGDRLTIDLLVRYLYRGADGGPGELASSSLGTILERQGGVAIAVLDGQSEAVRHHVLRTVLQTGFTPTGRQAFAAQVAKQPNSPTAKTWAAVQRE
jgi:Bacterial SH3 domain